MAQLALGIVGAAVGFWIGGPVGAQAGFMLGTAIGGVVQSAMSGPIKQEGPRLDDLSVSSSTYGTPIALLYGTARLPGQMIWTGGIQERRHVTKKSQGKGGQTVKTTNFTYDASFAMAFCEGPVNGLVKLFADGKLLYDSTAREQQSDKFRFRFYTGDETQLPDSIIEAKEGAGNVPGHRGLCYIVIDTLQLADYGNRIPVITAEITVLAKPSMPVDLLKTPPLNTGNLTY